METTNIDIQVRIAWKGISSLYKIFSWSSSFTM